MGQLFNPPPIPSGTAFPSAPATNDRFHRSDRNITYQYDGTRWLSTQLFSLGSNFVSITATTTVYLPVPWQGTYSLWIERFDASTFLSGTGEWDVILNWISAANALTAFSTLDGSTDVASTWHTKTAAPGVVLDANARALAFVWTEVSGTATYVGNAVLFYRLVG